MYQYLHVCVIHSKERSVPAPWWRLRLEFRRCPLAKSFAPSKPLYTSTWSRRSNTFHGSLGYSPWTTPTQLIFPSTPLILPQPVHWICYSSRMGDKSFQIRIAQSINSLMSERYSHGLIGFGQVGIRFRYVYFPIVVWIRVWGVDELQLKEGLPCNGLFEFDHLERVDLRVSFIVLLSS